MPFTPFHLGPALLIGLLALRWLDLPTFLAANVIVDVRAALVLFGYLDGPLHGPLTTFAGGTVVAILLAALAYPVRPLADPLLERIRLTQPRSAVRMTWAALLGIWLHVALDAILYADVQPFAPFTSANPLLGTASTGVVYIGCVVAGVLGLGVYALHVLDAAVPGLDANRFA